MSNPSSSSQESIKSRVNKIKGINNQSYSSIKPSPNTLTSNSSSMTNNNSNHAITQEELKQSFKQALNNTNKDSKYCFFIQQANEMFQNYERDISELRQKLLKFEESKLTYTPSAHSISLCLSPTRQDVFFSKMKQLSNEEMATMEDIRNEYNKKISELYKENADLTKMIDKITNTVITKLQDKIQELSEMFDKEKKERVEAQNELESFESINQENTDLKSSNIEKDNYIITLDEKVSKCEREIRQQTNQINYMTNIIESFKETMEQKEKKLAENKKAITDYKASIEKLKEEICLKQKEIKEKEDEIKLLVEDNVQWEEKSNCQLKEIADYKRWSLWDDNLIDAYKKIEMLQSEIELKNSNIDKAKEDNERLVELNAELTQELKERKNEIASIKGENDSLMLIKVIYDKEKDKLDNYDSVLLENLKMTKEISSLVDKYENQIQSDQRSYENKLASMQTQYETDIKTKQSEYDTENNHKATLIEELEKKVNEILKENKEITDQLEKKTQMTVNLKEAYDNLINKYKAQEEKLNLFESSAHTTNNSIMTINGHISIANPKTSETSNACNEKIHSSFDKYAFTTQVLIDYFYCLYLYESSVNIQNLTDLLLSNMNLYLNTLFQNQQQSGSIITEFLEDIFFLSYTKYFEKASNKHPEDLNYKISFEHFDRDTIDEICNDLFTNNPLSALKPQKNISQLINLFISKYESVFDFDTPLQAYLNKEIIPMVKKKIQKHQVTIIDDLHTVIEMVLNNIKEGKIISNSAEIYSYEQYHNQFKRIAFNESQKTFEVQDELKDKSSIDNVAFYLKKKDLSRVCFNKVFNWNIEESMTKIVTTMILYSQNIIALVFKGNNGSGSIFKTQINRLLRSLKRLKALDLSNNALNDVDVKLLCDTIKVNHSIEELNIECNKITTAGGYYLADAFSKNKSITSLNASNNQLNEGGLVSLFGVLANNNSTLTKLFIGGNSLTKDDYTALSEYLSLNPALSLLDISGNSIDVKSANNLGIAFRKAKHLKVLFANMMNLDEESCSLLLNYLNETEISEISLDKNVFSDTGSIVFVNKIKLCVQLERVSLKMCGLPPMFFSLFAQLFKNKSNMKQVNFESNPLDDTVILLLGKGLTANPSLIVKISKGDFMPKTIEALSEYKNIVFV